MCVRVFEGSLYVIGLIYFKVALLAAGEIHSTFFSTGETIMINAINLWYIADKYNTTLFTLQKEDS